LSSASSVSKASFIKVTEAAQLVAPFEMGVATDRPLCHGGRMSSTPLTLHRRAIAMLLLANLFWGLSFPLIKALGQLHASLAPDAPDALLTLYTIAPRFLLAVVLMVLWRPRLMTGITACEWRQGLTLGLFAAGGMFLQNEGLRYTHASTSAFLTQLYAVLIPLWWAAVRRTAPGWRVWTAVALVVVGGATLSRLSIDNLSLGRGEALTLLCSLFFMGQILTLERASFRANDPLRVTLAMFVVEGVVFWGASLWAAGDARALWLPWTSPPWVLLTLGLTAFCTIAAFTLMNAWQPKISSTEAGLIYCVEPLFGAVLALFIPGLISVWTGIAYANETLSAHLLLGGALITAANILVQLAPSAAPSAQRLDNH
jgi:drug/metabolite transporter (DMT)-like permease